MKIPYKWVTHALQCGYSFGNEWFLIQLSIDGEKNWNELAESASQFAVNMSGTTFPVNVYNRYESYLSNVIAREARLSFLDAVATSKCSRFFK
jgi:hypothetical protein